jgi:hypothetical protein
MWAEKALVKFTKGCICMHSFLLNKCSRTSANPKCYSKMPGFSAMLSENQNSNGNQKLGFLKPKEKEAIDTADIATEDVFSNQ